MGLPLPTTCPLAGWKRGGPRRSVDDINHTPAALPNPHRQALEGTSTRRLFAITPSVLIPLALFAPAALAAGPYSRNDSVLVAINNDLVLEDVAIAMNDHNPRDSKTRP